MVLRQAPTIHFERTAAALWAGLASVAMLTAATGATARDIEEARPRPAQRSTAAKAPAKPTESKPAEAKKAPSPDDLPMQVQLVRDSTTGCEPNCLEWVSAQGRIVSDTRARFITVLGKLGNKRPPIFIDSAGGNVDAALAIAKLIRTKGFDVAVTKTTLTPCGEADAACRKLKATGTAQGRPVARLAKCASSCAFILAGGINRLVGLSSFVAVHQVATYTTMAKVRRVYRITRPLFSTPEKTLVSQQVLSTKTVRGETSSSTYDKIDKFFADMGIDSSMSKLIADTPNEKIHVLTRPELVTTRIMTTRLNGEQAAAMFTKTGVYDAKAEPPPVVVPSVGVPAAKPPIAPPGASVFMPGFTPPGPKLNPLTPTTPAPQ